jgi:hypothetical protein
MAVIPFGAMAQGNGKGKGNGQNGKGNGNHGHAKAVKMKQKGNDDRREVKVKQNKGNKGIAKNDRDVYYGNKAKRNGPPAWAPAHGYRAKQHAYFPDYYTFYDANRNGYSYWNGSGWSFSNALPGFLNGVDLSRARMEVLNDLSVNDRPEANYSTYVRKYPAQPVSITVPIPVIR